MSQQHFYSELKFDRIFMILRRGGLVMIRDERGNAGLIRAAEFADFTPEALAGLVQENELLCLTSRHMQAFGRALPDHLAGCSLPASTLGSAKIIALILGDGSVLPATASLLAERSGSLPDIACRLLKAARLIPAALLTRLTHNDSQQQQHLAENYQLPVLDAHELAQLDNDTEIEMTSTASAHLPLIASDEARIVMFREKNDRSEHFAVIIGGDGDSAPPLVRLHSQCVTGDVLGSLKCDCGPQLHTALSMMRDEGQGILLYLAQEGRDIGLLNKIRAYALQDKGLDTVDANHSLGFETDERQFAPAAAMLRALNCTRVRLLTNNPDKIARLEAHGITVQKRVPLTLPANPHNADYLQTKAQRSGHLLGSE